MPLPIKTFTLLLIVCLATSPVPAAEFRPGDLLPLELLVGLPETSHVALAPSGRKVAAAYNVDGRTLVLARDPAQRDGTTLLDADNAALTINWLRWANDGWLLVSTRFAGERNGVNTLETRLLSIAADGSKTRSMVRSGRRRYQPQLQDHVVDMLPDAPHHVLMAIDLDSAGRTAVYRVDVRNGRRRQITPALENVGAWLTDQQHGVRVALRQAGTDVEVLLRDQQSRSFAPRWRYEAFSASAITPVGFGLDPQELYALADHDGYRALFRFDLDRAGGPPELVFGRSGRDISGVLVHAPVSGAAVGFITDDGLMEFWEADFRALARGIAAAFPSRRTHLLAVSRDERRYLLMAESDRDPGTYYLGDRGSGALSPLASRHPRLRPELLRGHETVRFDARDGTAIEGFLTLPWQETRPLPAVVLPHGGPIAHDAGGFDHWSEFLANRGYAVLRLNFRGSSGYGIEHLRAGLGAWGLAMQDDVEDAARWLVREGIADPARLCIVGASYGGYAALMATIKAPALFRCAVSYAGVSDLNSLLRNTRRYANAEVAETIVGTDDLRKRSPLTHASTISTPVLLIHGSADRVVPVDQSRALHRALARLQKSHVYIEQPGGDHHLSQQQHRLQLFRQLEAFLQQHLGSGS